MWDLNPLMQRKNGISQSSNELDTMNSEIHPHKQKRMERNGIPIKNLERKICIQIYTQQMPMHKACLQFTIVLSQS